MREKVSTAKLPARQESPLSCVESKR